MKNRYYQDLQFIFNESIKAVKPDNAIRKYISLEENVLSLASDRIPLVDIERIFVVGAGKATAPMAKAVEDILGSLIDEGQIVVKYGHTENLKFIKIIEAGHPIPDQKGLVGAEGVVELAMKANKRDLVLCLLSGGGSALLPMPAKGLTLEDKQEVTRLLLRSGATIHEINTIRKHISGIKGGFLARYCYPAKLFTFVVSDVIGDDLSVIASGPTYPDNSTFQDCVDILVKYEILDLIPLTVKNHILEGKSGLKPETPKSNDECFEKTKNIIIANNRIAIESAYNTALKLGYEVEILAYDLEGESRIVAKSILTQIMDKIKIYKGTKDLCFIAGGETTVTVKGGGLGGRNQEMALSAALILHNGPEIFFMSCGTDGNDGPTDAAGAIVDNSTVSRALSMNIDPSYYLESNDSYNFFKKVGGHVITGPTNTNVMDLQ
ncbi:MAG: glycerate kinase, partial [Calditerrivibrio sp.]|nr:glycerate kinase [Calditerrivibrio sp.]